MNPKTVQLRAASGIYFLILLFLGEGLLGLFLPVLAGQSLTTATKLVPIFVARGSAIANDPSTALGLAPIVKPVLPVVVNISSSRMVHPNNLAAVPFFKDPFLRQFFGGEFFNQFHVPHKQREQSLGSGVIVKPDLTGEIMLRWIAFAVALTTSASAPVPHDVSAIIQGSVEATGRDWEAAPNYDYFQRVREDSGTKTYDVMMILGSPYERVTAVNDKPLTAEQEAQEQHKLDKTIAQRRTESPQERSQRVSKYMKERERDHLLIEQLTRAFDFELEGEQRLGLRKVYVLKATPRAGYHPPNFQAEVLTGMQGKLWVDEVTFQWVKVEAEVVRPVTIEGFLARVEPGTRFELERTAVDDGIWLPKHFAMKSRSKIVFLFSHKTQEEETYWGYRKAVSDQAR